MNRNCFLIQKKTYFCITNKQTIMSQKILLNHKEVSIILHRLACQLIENHLDFSNTILIGIQPRGTQLANRLKQILEEEYQVKGILLGFLDITFFRDDFRRGETLEANKTQIDFLVENKKVIFIDDVLYTGRSINAALSAIQSFGRPSEVELLVLIDRRFSRHLPIQPDYRGRQVDAINNETVVVNWQEKAGEDSVALITK
ncbi:Bifunctional protein PyrR (Includes: Pyrimidine operon regulatory protein; Uracil phosphoribosyltransferase) [Flavobacterium psychrophilum]|nr:Uracil phosphoribosyltransferase [Flavobacterium psychrophilum]SCX77934.1 pyrimidine operon attenuation protein / uracil phosphoribosyltransferase [Flavobacterium psychrophilum DSM 3660] [Flavobacterium psychrophilum DSM 3660 = ATCC 49418]SNA68655.1 Bifunctional protein PyrR (Includes: Pyrimidine operon regulatory protein; Uracil phosphoribosyltransferase) [Flavobacterium psychrophilum]SNA72098.1 Bifunctional protein PyrR (Includes: Pyrimidine operon regulatory protein; Uracil phosphoribosylt